jgi:hypothetical protein
MAAGVLFLIPSIALVSGLSTSLVLLPVIAGGVLLVVERRQNLSSELPR